MGEDNTIKQSGVTIPQVAVEVVPGVVEPVKQVENKLVPNPGGKGGFGDHPELINKKGRPPRGWSWAEIIEEEVGNVLNTKDGLTIEAKKAIIMRLIRMAVEGDIQAMKEIFNRMDGMPTVRAEIKDTTEDDKKIDKLAQIINDFSKK